MKTLLWNILLALAWVAASGSVKVGTFLTGYLLGYLALWVSSGSREHRSRYFSKLPQLATFTGFMLREILVSTLRVSWDVVTPTHHMRPAVLAVPLEAKSDGEITVIANLLTLTPGTLMLDVSPDRRSLYMHAMYVDDPDAQRERTKKGYEQRVLELLR